MKGVTGVTWCNRVRSLILDIFLFVNKFNWCFFRFGRGNTDQNTELPMNFAFQSTPNQRQPFTGSSSYSLLDGLSYYGGTGSGPGKAAFIMYGRGGGGGGR